VELGFAEVLEAALAGSAEGMPTAEAFANDYSQIVGSLHDVGAEVLLLTIPDPFDTAHFPLLDRAADTVKVEAVALCEIWQVDAGDRITVNGLNEIGFQIFGERIGPLLSTHVVPEPAVRQIRERLRELNESIARIGEATGAATFDLHALLQEVQERGV